MHVVVFILVLLAAHFCLTAFVPSPEGQAQVYWPWATNTRPVIAGMRGLPQEGGGVLTPALAAIAGLCLLGAAAALMGIVVPANLWMPLVLVGTVGSIALFVLYLGPLALIPLALDLILLWGVVLQGWTVAGLRGG